MPDKEGAEEKSTKSVVNKKQKQFMNQEEYATEMVKKIVKKISARAVYPTVAQNKVRGEIIKGDDLKIDNKNPVKKKLQKDNLDEEGYDIARDMGKVRPSKDKKDATTMPPSKEMEKTRKVNKGPSALELVKKKYKGQIMDVKKEELDLTKVAEAFGGYIIEQEDDGRRTLQKYIDAYNATNPKPLRSRVSDAKMNTKMNNNEVEVTDDIEKIIPKNVKLAGGSKVTGDVQNLQGPKVKTRSRNRVLQRVRIAARSTKRPVQRLVKPVTTPVAKFAKTSPLGATIAGIEVAKITPGIKRFFTVKPPLPPAPKGGKVGRRTAG